MHRYIFLVLIGLTTPILQPSLAFGQGATGQGGTAAAVPVSHEYHVIGDVQAPGAHVSSMDQEWLVNLLKVARLFPAESYQLRLVRDGSVEWEAHVPSNQKTPSIQMSSGDILVVQALSQTAQGIQRTETDTVEVAFLVPGRKVELKSVQQGMTFAELAPPTGAGPLQTLIPPSGDSVTGLPEQQQLYDGDVLVFAAPGAIGLPTMPRGLATLDQRPTPLLTPPDMNAQRQATVQQPFAPQLQTPQLHAGRQSPVTSQGPPLALPVITAGNSSRFVTASQTRTVNGVSRSVADGVQGVLSYANEQATVAQGNLQTAQRQLGDTVADGMSTTHGVVQSTGSELQHHIDSFSETTAVYGDSLANAPPLLVADPDPVTMGQQVVEEITNPQDIRAALQGEQDRVAGFVDSVAPGLDFDSSNEFQMDDQNTITNRLGGVHDSVVDSANSAMTAAGDHVENVVGGLETSVSGLEASFGGTLQQSESDAEALAAESDTAARRKYSSILFVLLLLGSITSLIFIWSKKNDQTLENQFDKLKNYGTDATATVAAAGAAVTANVADAVQAATESLGATSAEVTAPVASATASMMAVGESRLDQLIHNRVAVSREASRIQRTFELNAEPMGPKRYRIDAGASPMQKGPHFQMPAATESTEDSQDEQEQSTRTRTRTRKVRVDGQSAPASRSQVRELPEGRLDRALNSIEGVNP